MAINPRTPYLGSSELPKALSWFMLGEGRKKVLIVSPKSVDALSVGGLLPDGFEPIIATTGKQALGILQYEPEIYAVFYSMDLYSVPPFVFLEKIRAIPVAADVPVAITANSNRFEEPLSRLYREFFYYSRQEYRALLLPDFPHFPYIKAEVRDKFPEKVYLHQPRHKLSYQVHTP